MAGPEPPRSDVDSAPFWTALAERTIRLQRCDACHEVRFPPMPTCPYCSARGATDVHATGHGSVYSWVCVEYPLDDRFSDQVPYTVAVVELDEGPRIAGRVEGTIDFGTAVEAQFVDHDGWTELRFAGTA